MTQPLLVIVTGAPCTGKTALAHRIALETGLPLVTKDDIKERLFDALGTGDRAWSTRLGSAAYDLLYYVLETQLRAGRSLIVESNFKPEASAASFLELRGRYAFDVFQILCRTESTVLLERFRSRWLAGERHPGHVDEAVYADFARDGMGNYEPLPLDGTTVIIDTTDLSSIDHASIIMSLRAALASGPR